MPTVPLMTWVSARKGWMKSYRSKMYSVSCRQLRAPATKEGSTAAANAWWSAKQREVDDADANRPDALARQRVEQSLAGLDIAGLRSRLEAAIALIEASTPAQGRALLDEAMNPVRRLLGHVEYLEPHSMATGANAPSMIGDETAQPGHFASQVGAANGKPYSAERSIRVWVERWLAFEQSKVPSQMSMQRFSSYKNKIGFFERWIGGDTPVDDINEARMTSWETHLNTLMNGGRSPHTCRLDMLTAQRFIKWLARDKVIPRPQNLAEMTVRVPTVGTKRFPKVDEVLEILKAYREFGGRSELYVMLALNLGAYQFDISELRQDEIDWKAGRVHRTRSKMQSRTGERDERLPGVMLWPETLKLLKANRAAEGERVLATDSGKPLCEFNDKGRSKDAVTAALARAKQRTGKGVPLKSFRKLMANLIEKSEYRDYLDFWLGHTPKTTAGRSYVIPDQKRLDSMLRYMRKQLFGSKKLTRP